MSAQYQEVVETAREYYNSDDADNFYFRIWGGEDIHVGLYQTDDEDIRVASQRTVATMAETIHGLNRDMKVVDLGAGYGGSARWLVEQYGCQVSCINLSETQNERNRKFNREKGLEDYIEVVDGSFETLPYDNNAFDIAWSQDAILHSGNRSQVMDEIDRVLKPGGQIIFTDPMQADDCPSGVLQPVLDRIHLDTLGSFAFYREEAKRLNWNELGIQDLTHQLVNHYTRVRQELISHRDDLRDSVSQEYIERMIEGLGHWINAGGKGYLAWGIIHFQKPE